MRLKILTWNLAWGYGIGSDGSAYRPLPLSHFESSLDAMSEMIHNLGVDIVLLQEVDFRSRRSFNLSELDIISRKSGLLYREPIVSWNHLYVPFPGLKPSGQFGPILSGGGILSRFPIKSVFSELLPKPKENLALYNWFYLSRYLQIVEIEGFRLCNLHLEAFSQDNRAEHLAQLAKRIEEYEVDITGGDFNGPMNLPKELSLHYTEHPSPTATFPSHAPTDVIDGFILKKKRFEKIEIKTIDTGMVSDHFAVLADIAGAAGGNALMNGRSSSFQVS